MRFLNKSDFTVNTLRSESANQLVGLEHLGLAGLAANANEKLSEWGRNNLWFLRKSLWWNSVWPSGVFRLWKLYMLSWVRKLYLSDKGREVGMLKIFWK